MDGFFDWEVEAGVPAAAVTADAGSLEIEFRRDRERIVFIDRAGRDIPSEIGDLNHEYVGLIRSISKPTTAFRSSINEPIVRFIVVRKTAAEK